MNLILEVILKAIIVGLFTIIIGQLLGFLMHNIYTIDFLPEVCNTWNKYYIMEQILFLTGFLIHIISQLISIYNC